MVLQADAVVGLENYADEVKAARGAPGFVGVDIKRGGFKNAFALGLVKGVQGAEAAAGGIRAAFNFHKDQGFAVTRDDIQLQASDPPVALHNGQAALFKKGGGPIFPPGSGNQMGGFWLALLRHAPIMPARRQAGKAQNTFRRPGKRV